MKYLKFSSFQLLLCVFLSFFQIFYYYETTDIFILISVFLLSVALFIYEMLYTRILSRTKSIEEKNKDLEEKVIVMTDVILKSPVRKEEITVTQEDIDKVASLCVKNDIEDANY